VDLDATANYISTGHLPDPIHVQRLVDECYERFSEDSSGVVSDVYPALSEMDPAGFGIALIGSEGREYTAGDVDTNFTIMSVAKPFVFARDCHSTPPRPWSGEPTGERTPW
jgi:glutaminase